MFLRSLLLQSTWNFERMQNLGFAYALAPALTRLHGSGEALDRALQRHLEVFNTHPYMASAVLGMVLKLEESLAAGGGATEAQIRSLKLGLLGSYGAIGDGLVWAGLGPLAMIVAALVGVLTWSAWWGLAVFLGVYNLGHLVVRLGGFVLGYERGMAAVLVIRDFNLPRWTRRIRTAALGLLGVLAAWAVTVTPWGGGGPLDLLEGAALMALAFGVWRYLGAGRSATSLVYWIALGAITVGMVASCWGRVP